MVDEMCHFFQSSSVVVLSSFVFRRLFVVIGMGFPPSARRFLDYLGSSRYSGFFCTAAARPVLSVPDCSSFCLSAFMLGVVRLVLRGRDTVPSSQSRLVRFSNRRLPRQIVAKSNLSVVEQYFLLAAVFSVDTFVTAF